MGVDITIPTTFQTIIENICCIKQVDFLVPNRIIPNFLSLKRRGISEIVSSTSGLKRRYKKNTSDMPPYA